VQSLNVLCKTSFNVSYFVLGDYKRIRSLRAPDVKMSKSALDARSRIELFDSADDILEKIRKSVTDSTPTLTYDPILRPGIANLLELHAAVRGCPRHGETRNGSSVVSSGEASPLGSISTITPQVLCEQYASLDTLAYKTLVAEELVEHFRPVRDKIIRLQANRGYLIETLKANNDCARQIASCTYEQVAQRVGFK